MGDMLLISYNLTYDQAISICKHFNKNIDDLADYEICELLDKLIDESTN